MSDNYYQSEYPTSEYTYSEYSSSSNNEYQQTTTEYHSSYYSSSTTNYEEGFETPRPSYHGLGGYGAPDRRESDDDDQLLEQEDDNQLFLKVKPSMVRPPEDYKLSTCEGRKRALLIGINYFGTENELSGCINDVHNVKNFLIDLYGFKEEDMVILTDDQQDPKLIPTRANIIAAMQWLVHDADDNDSFFLHYSGHGGSVPDENGDEPDGFDETIYPVDFQEYEGTSGQIIDDDLYEILVKPLPKGCRLTAIFDSCHSGTVLNLPFIYSTKGTIKDQNLFKNAGRGLLEAGIAYATGDSEGALSSLKELGLQLLKIRSTEEDNREKYYSPADVIQFSGCKDDQTSADAQEAGKATGAMSYAFITSLRANPNQTYQELLNSVRDILRDKYSQRPQLSSSHPIDTSLRFVC